MPKATLKVLRVGANMTQTDVAKKLSISPATWSKWERGETYPNVKEIKKIEKLFNIGYSDIIFLINDTV